MNKKRKARRIGSKIHNKVNSIRKSKGLSRLRGDSKLRQQAENYAREMAKRDTLGHNVDGLSPQSRYNGSGNSENCLYVYDKGSMSKTANHAVSTWMDSPDHRKNILRKSSSYDGVGVWFRKNKVYVVHAFARRLNQTQNVSVDLNIKRLLVNTSQATYRLSGRALETPYAPIRVLNSTWWRILPRRRQRSLTVGIILGGLCMWIALETDALTRLPETVAVNNTEVSVVLLVVPLVILGEIVRLWR